jgi:hypothetical protein
VPNSNFRFAPDWEPIHVYAEGRRQAQPLGIAALGDRIVQAVALAFSCGFPHSDRGGGMSSNRLGLLRLIGPQLGN